MQTSNQPEERFIDAESQSYGNEGQSYDSIIIMQIKECVKVLSKDPINLTETISKGGMKQKSIELYEEEFNHIDTLKMLMSPFIEGDDIVKVKALYDKIENYKKELGEKKISVTGKGIFKLSELDGGLPSDHILSKKFAIYKSQIARDLFEVLVVIYHTKKEEIASFSYEES